MQAARLFVTGLLLWAGWAGAQQVTLAPSAAIECLTPPPEGRGDIEYPFAELKSGVTGRVRIEARFTVPEGPPELTVLESDGGDVFVSAVKTFMRSWRVPCLPPSGGDARLVQEYVFKPDTRRVYWARTEDAADPRRRELLGCFRHESGRKAPDYPSAALRQQVQGRVVARLRFEAADRSPVVQVHARRSARDLQDAIETWVRGYRMPCLTGGPIDVEIVFVYRLEGDAFGFKPLLLTELLGSVKGIREQRLVLDTTTMGCPFDLRFIYFQPFLKNQVGSIGSSDPAREPLLRYLADIELDMRARSLDAIFADRTTVTVPCLKIDLNPKEKS